MTFPESTGDEWKGDGYAEVWGHRELEEFTEDERQAIFRAFYWSNAEKSECDCCTELMAEFGERFGIKPLTGHAQPGK